MKLLIYHWRSCSVLKVPFSRCVLQNKSDHRRKRDQSRACTPASPSQEKSAIKCVHSHAAHHQGWAEETYSIAAIGCFRKTHGSFWRCWLWSWEYRQGVCQGWNSWAGSSQTSSYNSATGPGHHPASSRMLFLCGCRAVPKAKLSFQKGEEKKKATSSAYPSLAQLFFYSWKLYSVSVQR